MTSKTWHIWLWAAVIALSFFAADCLSLHTGDDLGYMFTDTVHHKGDGVRVTDFADIIRTQNSHYMTTNGRWLVHVTVMTCLNLMPLWLYRALNAIAFTALWWLIVRLVAPRKRPSDGLCGATWLLLLAGFPQPSLLLFTLVSYSVNYLWVGVAAVGLLVAVRDCRRVWLVCLLAFFTGTLQESYSVPLCAGFFVASLMKKMRWQYTVALILGTAVCAFAPGNLHHAAQTGSILHKLTALGTHLPYMVVSWGLLAWLLMLIWRKSPTLRFTRRHMVLFVAIATSLAMACLTYTAPRQLTCPTLFAIILIIDALAPRLDGKIVAPVCASLAIAFLAAITALRWPVYRNWQSLVRTADKTVAYPAKEPTWDVPYNYLTEGLWPDPLASRGLMATGDRYTVNGLRRLSAPRLKFILPAAPSRMRTSRTFRLTRFPRNTKPPRALQNYTIGDTLFSVSLARR